MSFPVTPRIEIFSHLNDAEISLAWLTEQAVAALPLCLASPGTEAPDLAGVEEIEISLVSDEVIAGVHGEFMDDPTPTDVITFQHGEILISIDTARREAPLHGHTVAEETLLYLIHGLLHLNGHTDLKEPDRLVMHEVQEEILRKILVGPTKVPSSHQ